MYLRYSVIKNKVKLWNNIHAKIPGQNSKNVKQTYTITIISNMENRPSHLSSSNKHYVLISMQKCIPHNNVNTQ
jgi:hypothetical protein